MVAIAQLVEHWIVIPGVAGSIPVGHPNFKKPLFKKLNNGFFFLDRGDGSTLLGFDNNFLILSVILDFNKIKCLVGFNPGRGSDFHIC